MHTWAAIEHQLGYKANQELDEKLKRKFYFPKYKKDRGKEEQLLVRIIRESLTITNISSYAKQLLPYVELIDAQVVSKEKTTRANLMIYGLEIFAPNFRTYALDDRMKIIDSVKETLSK